MAVTEEGKVFIWGGTLKDKIGQTKSEKASSENYIPKLQSYFADRGIKIKSVACGQGHSMALSRQGQLYTWGAQDKYQCGVGQKGYEDISEPTLVPTFAQKPLKLITCG